MTAAPSQIETACINTIRGLAMDAVQAAKSGHPGMPMGAAPMAHALWTEHLRHNPRNPKWMNRDRFVLSAGHGSMLLYALLHLTGYDLSLAEIRNFRQWGSKTPGHPENTITAGVEMATGPLGQGFATAIGMAIAERYLAATFNRDGFPVVDHHTYAIVSDGDLMEGISNEAASLAGHLGLGKVIFLYDDNRITIDGTTDIAFTEDVAGRFEALGWQVQKVDGMDPSAVSKAIHVAKAETGKPSLICCKTVIGFGSPNRANTSKAHGEPLGDDEVRLSKEALGIPLEPKFLVDDEVKEFYGQAVQRGQAAETEWSDLFARYRAEFPHEAEALLGNVNDTWKQDIPMVSEPMATRAISGKVLNAVAHSFPGLIGGSADLAGSNNSVQKEYGHFQKQTPGGKNLSFGVREHAMAAIVNGITLHGGARGYGATFLQFADYCKASLRLAALMECPSIFLFTHDSIGLGEDGPTHQPIEHLAGLRAIPNFNVVRPCDGAEVAAAWIAALESQHTPTALMLTRQAVPPLGGSIEGALKGGYVLREASTNPRVILVATGSEVSIAVEAQGRLESEGFPTRVVSLPSWFAFETQPEAYRSSVLPKGIPTASIEAGSTFGWAKYADLQVGIDHFGASAPADRLYQEFGVTVDNLVRTAKSLL
ncbi:MAG TPA: transketolase [Fimbriimonadaceae bacterium]|nr:transketolase [Fimbriimonadaceae bacterium]